METKYVRSNLNLKEDAEGTVQAVFSTFNVIDSDGDVVLPSAFTPGQEVPMVWSHDWQSPIGKGVVKVDPDRAIFDGSFFMDTTDGEQAFRKVRAMGNLQEWSWGFRILEDEIGEFDGKDVRFINRAEVFEVSPVLVGANRETHTLAVKGKCPHCGKGEEPVIDVTEPLVESSEWEEADRLIALALVATEERLAVDIT